MCFFFLILLSEFWEEHFQCRYPRSTRTPYNTNYSVECDPNFHLRKKKPKFENQLQFVSDSVLAFAHALYDMHSNSCGPNFTGLCDAMKPVKGPELLKYLREVNFTGESFRLVIIQIICYLLRYCVRLREVLC